MKALIVLSAFISCHFVQAKEQKPTGVYDGVYHIANSSSTTFKVNKRSFQVAAIAGKMLCQKDKIDNFNFSKEFADLFSSTYLNQDVSKIKGMSKFFNTQHRNACKNKGHYSFSVQPCFEGCWKNFPIKHPNLNAVTGLGDSAEVKLMRTQCLATCSSLDRRFKNYVHDMEDFSNHPDTTAILCDGDFKKVDQSPKTDQKKIESFSDDTLDVLDKVKLK